MSHFTKAAIKITSLAAAIKACRELGFNGKLREGKHTIVDFYKKKVEVEASINVGQYDIGFTNEGTDENGVTQYAIGADWMMMGPSMPRQYQNKNDAEIQNAILQRTALNTIVPVYEAQGFNCEVVEQKNGEIELTLSRESGRF